MEELDPLDEDDNDIGVLIHVELVTDVLDKLLQVERVALRQCIVDLVLEEIIDTLGPLLQLIHGGRVYHQVYDPVEDFLEDLLPIEDGLFDDLNDVEKSITSGLLYFLLAVAERLNHWVDKQR